MLDLVVFDVFDRSVSIVAAAALSALSWGSFKVAVQVSLKEPG